MVKMIIELRWNIHFLKKKSWNIVRTDMSIYSFKRSPWCYNEYQQKESSGGKFSKQCSKFFRYCASSVQFLSVSRSLHWIEDALVDLALKWHFFQFGWKMTYQILPKMQSNTLKNRLKIWLSYFFREDIASFLQYLPQKKGI